jgi:hypothetical protein
MTLDKIHGMIRNLSERIYVLEAERAPEKYILPLYTERSELLGMITSAESVK